MAKIKSFVYSLFFLSIITFFAISCGGVKDMEEKASNIQYKVNPNPLELHKGKVTINVTVEIPGGYMNPDAIIEAQLIMTGLNEFKYKFEKVIVQGENIQDDYDVISFENGGSINFSEKIDYNDDMKVSELYAVIDVIYKGKTLALPVKKLADGVITTSEFMNAGSMFDYSIFAKKEGSESSSNKAMKKARLKNKQLMAKTINAKVKVQKTVSEKASAYIYYEKNKYKIRNSELEKEDIKNLEEKIRTIYDIENRKIVSININSSTSPEGGERLNEDLVNNRGNAGKKFLSEIFKSAEIDDEIDGFYNEIKDRKGWSDTEFVAFLRKSEMSDKDAILGVLKMYNDPEVINKEIDNIVHIYKDELEEMVLPKLRRSLYEIVIETGGISDERISELSISNPNNLSKKQLIYAATLTSNLSEKKKIYKVCIEIYSDAWQSYNNLGNIYLLEDDLNKAEEMYNKAREKNSNEPIIANNLGVVALMKNNFEMAEKEFKNASGSGENSNYNLGLINLKKGNYAAASRYFGTTPSFNAALSKLLIGNPNTALTILNKLDGKNVGIFYYLKAILAVRTKDTDSMFKNLRMAIDKDPLLGKYAKNDIEFGKFFEDDTFKTIVK